MQVGELLLVRRERVEDALRERHTRDAVPGRERALQRVASEAETVGGFRQLLQEFALLLARELMHGAVVGREVRHRADRGRAALQHRDQVRADVDGFLERDRSLIAAFEKVADGGDLLAVERQLGGQLQPRVRALGGGEPLGRVLELVGGGLEVELLGGSLGGEEVVARGVGLRVDLPRGGQDRQSEGESGHDDGDKEAEERPERVFPKRALGMRRPLVTQQIMRIRVHAGSIPRGLDTRTFPCLTAFSTFPRRKTCHQ